MKAFTLPCKILNKAIIINKRFVCYRIFRLGSKHLDHIILKYTESLWNLQKSRKKAIIKSKSCQQILKALKQTCVSSYGSFERFQSFYIALQSF